MLFKELIKELIMFMQRLRVGPFTFFRGTPATEVKHGLSLHMVSAAGWRQLQVTSGHWPQLSWSADWAGHCSNIDPTTDHREQVECRLIV